MDNQNNMQNNGGQGRDLENGGLDNKRKRVTNNAANETGQVKNSSGDLNVASDDGLPQKKDQKKEEEIQRKVLFKWESPMRHFKKIDKKKFFMILAAVLAFFVVLVLVGQWWLMAAIASVMFLVYVWGTVPPAKLTHIITNQGVESGGNKADWGDLTEYWYSRKDDQFILNVETELRLPGRFIMLVSDDELQKTHEILSQKLKYKEMKKQDRISKVTDGVWVDMMDDGEREG